MYGNFSCYHSLYGFVVWTRIVLQALWEYPTLGTENILSITSQINNYIIHAHVTYPYASSTSCLFQSIKLTQMFPPPSALLIFIPSHKYILTAISLHAWYLTAWYLKNFSYLSVDDDAILATFRVLWASINDFIDSLGYWSHSVMHTKFTKLTLGNDHENNRIQLIGSCYL